MMNVLLLLEVERHAVGVLWVLWIVLLACQILGGQDVLAEIYTQSRSLKMFGGCLR